MLFDIDVVSELRQEEHLTEEINYFQLVRQKLTMSFSQICDDRYSIQNFFATNEISVLWPN